MERVAIKAEMASFARERQALEIIFRSGSSLAIFECGDSTKIVGILPYRRSIVRNLAICQAKTKCSAYLSSSQTRKSPNWASDIFSARVWCHDFRARQRSFEARICPKTY